MPVEIREEELQLNTYVWGPEDPYPPFQRRTHWDIYPYPMMDDLGEEIRTVSYRALVLENEYLRLTVLPALGGHLHSAVDKATGQELFYHNHVVKPGLIALRGAWISGGVEWNFPRGHTVTTISPVDSRLVKQEDGAATIWVGDVERKHRMSWSVGIRLRPGSSLIETEIRLANRTPLPHPYYFWANAAVPARDDMRLIYPATRARTWQGETDWPIHEGRDLSRYDAFRWSADAFMLDSLEDFFGVYYDDSDSGVVHVANVHDSFGKKYFTWGTAEVGRMWASLLSDDDGPYSEIQSGKFVDQSTFRLLAPHDSQNWIEYWYPVKGIGGFAWANREAAVRISTQEGSTDIGVVVTRPVQKARVQIAAGERVLHEMEADLSPDAPLRKRVPIKQSWPEGPYTLVVLDAAGSEIIRYTENQLPRTVKLRPPTVAEEGPESNSTGALLRKAVHTEETAGWETALAAYQEALDADPNCVDAMVAVGRLKVSSDLDGAVSRLSNAASLAPERADAAYYLGLALTRAGRREEAEVELHRAARSPEFAHAARVELAQLIMRRGEWEPGAAMLAAALSYDPEDTRAFALLAAALRKDGDVEAAESVLAAAREMAPLDRLVVAEQHLCAVAAERSRAASKALRKLQDMLPDDADPWLELALDYVNSGLTEDALALLEAAGKRAPALRESPLVQYAWAYWLSMLGQEEEAEQKRASGSWLSSEYVFPHHWELEAALRHAIAQNPEDGAARHYLGMLLYHQGRRKAALTEWELAAKSGEKSVVLDRNLALAYREVGRSPAKAAEALRRAAAQKPTHQRVYLELDEVLREMKADPQERLAVLDAAPPEVHRRSLVATQQITACLELGDWGRAVTLLSTHTFHRWEMEFRMRGLYIDAYLGRGAEKLDGGDLEGARADFEAALLYPENLRIGKPAQTEDARARWCAGLACERQGDLAAAKAQWKEAAAETYSRQSHTGALDVAIYRALCLRELGKTQEADEALEQELKVARERAEADPKGAAAQMTLGLALKAAGRQEEADPALRRALELYSWMPRAKRLLEQETIL